MEKGLYKGMAIIKNRHEIWGRKKKRENNTLYTEKPDQYKNISSLDWIEE